MADGEDAPASLSKMDIDDPSSGLDTDATPGASATNPYETDPDKIPKHDPYLLARGPHYGRYFPRADDFTPRYNYWYQSEPESISYWREVVGKYCTPENSLGGYGSGTTADREAFAAGSVIIRVDQESADGPAAEKYSLLNANELCAARKAEEVLRDVDVSVPIIYFCGTIEGKNVTVESRIPGVSLEVAWRYLSAEQRASFKQQCRQILQRLGTAGSSADGPSYVCRGLNSQLQPDVQRLERDILFSEKGEDEDLCLVHNDMVRSNIIVNNNRIVGILGWRRSGYFGHKRAAAVHRQLRTPERTYITGEGEDPGVEHAWADLYDSQEFEMTKESAMTNGHDTTGPKVKTEPSVTSLDKVPASVTAEGARPPYISDLDGTDLPDDHPTPKKINDLKRGSVSRASSSERSSPAAPTKPGATTKRSAAATKKGTATKKPAAKRRKLNAQDGDTEGRRSNTPSSSRASKTPASRKQGSVSVAGSPPPDDKKNANDARADEAEDEDYEGEEVFCICRKPDNHTWMIGCDGGCEDWFHGKCVNIDPRDADLIDKYICPNCQKEGKGSTTWKPMCRLKGCRRPARISKKFQSKYCSDEHGREFMRQKTAHLNLVSNSTAGKTGTGGRARGAAKGRRQDSHSVEGDAEESHNDDGGASNDDEEDDENDFQAQARRDREELGSRGGVLTAGELKAAVDGVSSAEEFRRLGEYIVSPPPEETGSGKKLGLDYDVKDLTYSPDEATKIQKLRKQRDELLHRREMLRARNTFLSLVRQRAKNVLERLKQVDPKGGWKDICGFDSRLSWCDEEFDEWRLSEAGAKILKDGNPDALAEIHPQEGSTDADGDTVMMDGANNNNNNNNEDNNIEAIARGVCVKKRCERHKQWLKVQQQDILFEQSLVSQGLAKCEREAKAVVERAVLRMWAEQDAAA